MTATDFETSTVDHRNASEKYRLETFSSLLYFSPITRHQLALAGFICRETECICPQCGVIINLDNLDEDNIYESNYFRKLHRDKVSYLGKRCAFLLCESGTNIDDLHPALSSQQQEKPQWDDAEQPDFSDYNIRLQTFQSWPHLQQLENTFVTPSTMARHGFYFSGPNDGVTCFYCGNTLTDWSAAIHSSNENIVQFEHARFFPCRFVIYTAGGKFVGDAGYFHIVSDLERHARNPMTSKSIGILKKPQSIDECLLTFEYWPENAPISAKNLAETGFYYLGHEFQVKCFMCDLEVDDWHYGMTALGTHGSRRPNCEIVRAILSTKTGDIHCIDEKWRLQTFDGYSLEANCDQQLCRELAACGFYRSAKTKHIRCAYCGVLIQPKTDSSIMSQHRYLAKQLKKSSTLDCPMVRAQCPTNIVIPDRERFPEYSEYQSVFERIKSFESYKERHKVLENFIRDRAEAGFFLDTMKRMRCFQCGNSLPINDKKLYEKHDIRKLHAHFYPTCEWVKEILGSKYCAQVLFDRHSSNEIQHQRSYNTQLSSASSLHSFSSIPTTPGSLELTNPMELNISDYYAEESDDEGYEPVATPPRAQFTEPISPPLLPLSPSSDLRATGGTRQGISSNDDHNQFTSPIPMNHPNPIQQLALQSTSPPVEISHTDIAPIDLHAFYAYESNRLDSFKRRSRDVFGQIKAEELANAGFYLNAEDTAILCPWCHIEVTEAKIERILRRRPLIPDSPLNDEPWTAMRIHRHENGQVMDKVRSWCPYVRRELGGLYPNVIINENYMCYPEYPSYSIIEKRIKSFNSDWIYPSGSRLSNVMMADAGFMHMGKGNVCCYYCGNKLADFQPRDCPFEEHALYHPLCDYILQKRGQPFVQQVLKDSSRTPNARQKIETIDTQQLKRIYFDRSGPSVTKNQRLSVKPVRSRSSTTSSQTASPLTTDNWSVNDDGCLLCCESIAVYQYDPCQHYPMCEKCSEKLTPEQHEECIVCRRRAKINFRVPQSSF